MKEDGVGGPVAATFTTWGWNESDESVGHRAGRIGVV